MKYDISKDYLINSFQKIINIPSPVGYYVELNPILEEMASELGLFVTHDNRSTTYITISGKNPEKTIMVGAHADTLGMMIYKIENDGKLRVRQLHRREISGIPPPRRPSPPSWRYHHDYAPSNRAQKV